jgi:cytochrome c oxidase subunit 3
VAPPDTVVAVDGAPVEGAPLTNPLPVGVIVWLSSELMFFAGLFAAYFTLRSANPVWPSAAADLEETRAAIFTAVLVVSSLTMHRSVRAAEAGRREEAMRWLAATFLLGLVFVVNQAVEYANLGFGIDTDAYGSIFWLLTGFHWLHVVAGLALMLALARLSWAGTRAPLGVHHQVVGYYWHFVDVVWVGVFAAVYLIQ